mmetsp:Transcript_78162/g.155317  ORF Transcript_78162/g.155317 Transcript_78162/m.155317 type:complete len:173 (-) Transcript_78162:733-1251(-)
MPKRKGSFRTEKANAARRGNQLTSAPLAVTVPGATSSIAQSTEPVRGEKDARNLTVDFSKLDMATLQRYKRHYRLKTRQNVTKTELALAVAKREPLASEALPMTCIHTTLTGACCPLAQILRRRRWTRLTPSRSSCTQHGLAACSTIVATTLVNDEPGSSYSIHGATNAHVA